MEDRERSYLSRDERHAQLLWIGLRLFSSQPYDAVSIDDLAREAGISKGLLYHYFGSKQQLFAAVVAYAASELLVALAPVPGRSGVENAQLGLRAYLGFVSERGDTFLALMSGGADAEVAKILEATRQAIVEQLLGAAEVDPASAPHRAAARAWLGAVEAVSLDWLRHRDLSVDALVDLLSASLFTQLLVAARQNPAAVRGNPLVGLPLMAGLTRG